MATVAKSRKKNSMKFSKKFPKIFFSKFFSPYKIFPSGLKSIFSRLWALFWMYFGPTIQSVQNLSDPFQHTGQLRGGGSVKSCSIIALLKKMVGVTISLWNPVVDEYYSKALVCGDSYFITLK